jgi:type VI secretion system protein VasJ
VTAGGNPVVIIGAVEQAVASRPFWLDLQRFGAQAAAQAGHENIVHAIRSSTADLVGRVPGLPALAFSDGTPFADDATRAWLQALAGAGMGETTPMIGEDPLAETLDGALELAGKGDLDGAVRVLHDAPAGNAGGRARLRRGLHVVRLCLNGGRPRVAAALVAGLTEEADRRALEEWEPTLALELWRAAHAAWTAASGVASGDARDDALRRAGSAFDRVCRLDPAAALRMAGADKKGAGG